MIIPTLEFQLVTESRFKCFESFTPFTSLEEQVETIHGTPTILMARTPRETIPGRILRRRLSWQMPDGSRTNGSVTPSPTPLRLCPSENITARSLSQTRAIPLFTRRTTHLGQS